MSCARWEERIAALVEDGLPPAQATEAEAHIAQCSGCADLKRELEETRSVLRELHEIEPADWDLDAVRRSVMERVSAPRSKRAWFPWIPAVAAASAVAMMLAVWLSLPREAGPPPLVRFPETERPVQVARSPVRPLRARPKRARPAPAGVVIQSAREMAGAEGGPPAQLVRIRTEDPRVELYWIVEMEGDQQK